MYFSSYNKKMLSYLIIAVEITDIRIYYYYNCFGTEILKLVGNIIYYMGNLYIFKFINFYKILKKNES